MEPSETPSDTPPTAIFPLITTALPASSPASKAALVSPETGLKGTWVLPKPLYALTNAAFGVTTFVTGLEKSVLPRT